MEASQETPKKPKRSSPFKNTRVAGITLLLLTCLSLGFLGGWAGSRSSSVTSIQSGSAKQQIIASESQLINQIAKDVSPSVVSINVTGQVARSNSFFSNGTTQQKSAGTGVIISSDGIIITNRHVVPAGTTKVSVTLNDGTSLDNVQVIGRTNDGDSLDAAFLKITDKKGETLQPAKLADSSKVQVGDKVVAIGNALGQFQNTVTSGIISGYGRDVNAGDESGSSTETLQNLFQTDTAINLGNSGGPLVNTSGEIVGINTAKADGENIGFAIPINDLQGLIKGVLTEGKLIRPYIGVHYVSLTDDLASYLNIKTTRGAYITHTQTDGAVVSGGPADKAGIKENDIITKINDVSIDEKHSFTSLLGQHAVGDTITLTVVRDSKEQTIKVHVEAAPEQ